MSAHAFQGGFSDSAIDAAKVFRAVMEAMARPGTLHNVAGALPPDGLSVAAGAAILTLCDADTGVHLAGHADRDDIRGWIAFHTGAPIVDAGNCDFAVGVWSALAPLETYKIGTPEYPDRSATLIVEGDALAQNGATLSGPGIKDRAQLSLPETEPFQRNARQFPLGLDFIFTSGAQLAALPRSTQVR